MLAVLVDEPFDDPDWSYEVKWDGYRALAYINKGEVTLASRNNKSFTEKYYPIVNVMEEWAFDAVLDGEILVIGKDGKANFGALQNWRSEADGDLVFYAFDLLWYNGTDIMKLPLSERQEILQQILPLDDDRVRLSQIFNTGGLDFFNAAAKMGLEGIMAKKSDSVYNPDSRSKQWLKIKVKQRQEVVIGGYTINEGTAKKFSSLLLGVYEKGDLQYVGKVGTGFTEKKQTEMMELFKPLQTKENPFSSDPDINKPSRFRPNPPKASAVWLEPSLVCEVSYAEITSDGVFRHPSFQGMRSDKTAKDVVRETASETEKIIDQPAEKKAEKKPLKKTAAKLELVSAPKGRKKAIS